MDWIIILFVLCSAAGLVLVVGSLLLLWKGRIFLDAKGTDISHVELPMGIKLDTHAPVLVIFLFGVFMLVFPVYYNKYLCPDPKLHTRIFSRNGPSHRAGEIARDPSTFTRLWLNKTRSRLKPPLIFLSAKTFNTE